MIGTITGLAEFVRSEEKEQARASCFPPRREKTNTGNTPITHDEEGRK
jgi:hypothetical protein